MIIVPQQHLVKPDYHVPLDWSNTITRDFCGAYMFMDRKMYNLGRSPTVDTLVGNPTPGVDEQGRNWLLGASNADYFSPTLPGGGTDAFLIAGAAEITIVAGVRRTANFIGSDEQTIVSNWASSGTGRHILWRFDPSNGIQFETHNGTNTLNLSAGTSFLPAVGEFEVITMRYDNGVKQIFTGKQGSATQTHGPTLSATNPANALQFGNTPHAATDFAQTKFYFMFVILRALQDEEIFAIVDNAYSVLDPIKYQVFLPTSSTLITSSLDSFLQKQIAITSGIDAQIQKNIKIGSTADAQIQKAIALASNLDSLLQKDINISAVADAILQKLVTITSSIDAILITTGASTITSSLDALVQKLVSISSSVDAVLSKGLTISSDIDAILAKFNTTTAIMDALIQKEIKTGAITDAHIQKTLNIQSAADAILAKGFILISSVDAILTGIAQAVSSVDGYIQKTDITAISSIDAVLRLEGLSVRIRRTTGFKRFDKQGYMR